jgi:hypothetical protein
MAIRLTSASSQSLSRSASLPSSTAYTACGWANRITTAAWGPLVCLENDGTSAYFNLQFDDTNSTLDFSPYDPVSGTFFTCGSKATNTPFFFAVTSAGTAIGDIKVYIRAASAAAFETTYTNTATWTSFTPATIRFGNDQFSEFLDGTLWNIKVWNRALTAAELLIESYCRRVMFPSSLNFAWPLDNATNLTSIDLSGNARPPTLGGTPTIADGQHGLWGPRRRIFIPATAASGAITGTTALTFGQSATLTGAGALTGSAALTLGQSGTLAGVGALSGTLAVTFGQTGTLSGSGALTASVPLTFGQTGTLTGSGALSASTPLTFGQSGTLTGSGVLAGTSALTFGITGTLDQPGGLSGTASLSFDASGALTATGLLSGTAAITFDALGQITGSGAGVDTHDPIWKKHPETQVLRESDLKRNLDKLHGKVPKKPPSSAKTPQVVAKPSQDEVILSLIVADEEEQLLELIELAASVLKVLH